MNKFDKYNPDEMEKPNNNEYWDGEDDDYSYKRKEADDDIYGLENQGDD